MNNISKEKFEEIREAIKMPEGTCRFEYSSLDLTNPAHSGGIIFEITAGAHVFRLDRTKELLLKFYYASPGTDTRVATIDLNQSPKCNQAIIIFTWSPKEINLYFGPKVEEGKLLSAKGERCKFQLQVGQDGSIYQIGDEHIEVTNIRFNQGRKQILISTAINSWRDTKKALEILETGKSDKGYVYESILSNLAISILITGFETYTRKRIIELEKEGINSYTSAFFSDSEKKKLKLFQKESKKNDLTLLQYIVENKVINFQNYKQCKRAYNKIFKISFGSIGVESNKLKKMQEFIAFRHRIIHVSALTGIMNESKVPPEEPIFSNKELLDEAIIIFDQFISKLHEATLQKRGIS